MSPLLTGHLNITQWNHNHSHFVMILFEYLKRLTVNFAKRNHLFKSLSKPDQMKILGNNMDLFRQYAIARYFSSANPVDQLSILMGSNLPEMGELCAKLLILLYLE